MALHRGLKEGSDSNPENTKKWRSLGGVYLWSTRDSAVECLGGLDYRPQFEGPQGLQDVSGFGPVVVMAMYGRSKYGSTQKCGMTDRQTQAIIKEI